MPAVDKDRRRFIAAVGTTSLAALAGCGGGGGGNTTTDTGPGAGTPIEVVNSYLSKGTFETLVQATIVNRGSSTQSYVGVQAEFLDSEGNVLGTSTRKVQNLEPDGEWSGAIVYDGDTDRAQIASGDDGYRLNILMSPPSGSGN